MAASTLDMALDDVIKKGGGGRAGKSDKKGGVGAGRKSQQNKGSTPADPPKPKEEDKKGLLSRLAFVKGIAAATMATAKKAANAAAKATATGKTPSTQGRVAIAAASAAAVSTKSTTRAASGGGGSLESTAAKLSMTLDDICKTETKGRRTKGTADGEDGTGRRRMRMKLRKDGGNLKRAGPLAKARAKGKAKSMARNGNAGSRNNGGKAGGKGSAGGWGSGGGGNSGREQGWGGDAWAYSKGGGKGGGWGSNGGSWQQKRGAQSDDWGSQAKRPRNDWGPPPRSGGSSSFGWGRGGNDDYGRGGGGGGGRWISDYHDHRGSDEWEVRRQAPERPLPDWERVDRDRFVPSRREREEWAKPPPERAERAERAAPRVEEPRRIKVTNVPMDLDRRDIKEAFEDRGRVVRCEVDRGVAFVTFERAIDAKKAVQTFDRGELNGQTIFVSLD